MKFKIEYMVFTRLDNYHISVDFELEEEKLSINNKACDYGSLNGEYPIEYSGSSQKEFEEICKEWNQYRIWNLYEESIRY